MGPILLSAAMAAPCPDSTTVLDSAATAVVEGRYDDVRAHLDEVERSFSCATPTPSDLARFWLFEGAVLVGEGDMESAALSLAAARRADAATFDDSLGSKVRNLWEAPTEGEGHLVLVPRHGPNEGLFNGQPAEWPVTTAAGVHLVQLQRGDEVRFGTIVNVTAGRLERIDTGVPAPAPVVPAPAPVAPQVKPERLDPPEMAILGGTALALGAASLAMWGVSTGQLDNATTSEEARRAQERRMAFGTGAVTLGAVGVLGIAGEFAF